MSVRVQLDQDHGHIYTNLDFVTGRVILTLPTDATISAITVKLEAESKSRLAGPRSQNDQDRKRTELEIHKLLYKVETVFPAPELLHGFGGKSSQFTLPRGQYEYPFKFKMPFNTDCINNTSIMKDLKVGQLNVQFGQEPEHSKNALPPTLGGFPGEADIRYYVKATVVRPKFYQENLRSQVDLKFLPIEPPRPPDRQQETFARRQHQFQHHSAVVKRSGLLRKMSAPMLEEEPLSFQVEARLPNPAIITCREPLPLRILVEKLNNSTASVYLSMIQIELIGHTSIRAHDLNRKESGTWLILSQANMNIPLDNHSNKSNTWTIPPSLWDRIPLPNTVAPSFTTCNINRRYELEVRIGLTHGMADGLRPELIVSPLRLDVEVYSGIAPPASLLQAMASQKKHTTTKQSRKEKRSSIGKISTTPTSPTRNSSYPGGDSFVTPPQSRLDSYANASSQSNIPSNSHIPPTTAQMHPIFDDPDDLPPSYEDVIADSEDIAPVADGPRRNLLYSVPGSDTPEQQRPAFNYPADHKTPTSDSASNAGSDGGSGLGRRISERLFSSNAPRPPTNRHFTPDANSGNNSGLPEEDEYLQQVQRQQQQSGTSNTNNDFQNRMTGLQINTVSANDTRGIVARSPVQPINTGLRGTNTTEEAQHGDSAVSSSNLPARKPVPGGSNAAVTDTKKG